ncbi:unnamed protein product [Durusdinium trenchii]|uniref:Exostosin GT47 domain-containing protein n=1 Tax=Durusdinium trenchii TaxID=1381693 RepID=A0ABP0HC71_9DINO
MAGASDIFVVDGPSCAGERLLSYEHYRGSPRREAFFSRMKWAIDLIRGLHGSILNLSRANESRAARVYYVPSFFSLLIALSDEESLRCLVRASAAITSSSLYWRNLGYDHFYVHGMEYPVVSDFDFAWAKPQQRDEAKLWMVRAFYASTRNMAILTTGELSQGPGSWALAGNLYNSRRVVNVPFTLHEGCENYVQEPRNIRLSFVGSVQARNHERLLFLRAAILEHGGAIGSGATVVKTSKLQLRAWVQVDKAEPLNHTQRLLLQAKRWWLHHLYRRSELCVVAPGDAPALGQRLSDVLTAGCIPVVLLGPGTQPVLPLQGAIPWEDFAVFVRLGDDVTSARWALRRLWAMSQKELSRRRERLLFWRPHLASSFGAKCSRSGAVSCVERER